jgi:hypothetical protein
MMNTIELFLADLEKLCESHNIQLTCPPNIALGNSRRNYLTYPGGIMSEMFVQQQQVDITLNLRAMLEGNVHHETDNRRIHPALKHDY